MPEITYRRHKDKFKLSLNFPVLQTLATRIKVSTLFRTQSFRIVVHGLKDQGGFVANGGVRPLTIVKHFDILENGRSGFFTGGIVTMMNHEPIQFKKSVDKSV